MMPMMQVFPVGVTMGPRRVGVDVVVLPLDGRLMGVIVMVPIVMAVGVLMGHRLVVMGMIVLLFQMQPDTDRHEQSTRHSQQPTQGLAEERGAYGAQKRRHGEHRARARRAQHPLRPQVHPEAEPKAKRPAGDQAEGREGSRPARPAQRGEETRRHHTHRALGGDNMGGIQIRERAGDRVVGGPGERRQHDERGAKPGGLARG